MNIPQQPESLQTMINKLQKKVDTSSASIIKLENRINELEKIPATNETKQFRFNALLSEMQNADRLVESHTRVSLVVSMALLAFATTEFAVAVPTGVLAALGGFVIIIWALKITRHKQIFDYCHDALGRLEEKSVRPKPHPLLHGFNLMYAYVAVIIIAWAGIMLDEPESHQPGSGIIEKKLSDVGARLDEALNDVSTTHNRLDELETGLQDINQRIVQKQQGNVINTDKPQDKGK